MPKLGNRQKGEKGRLPLRSLADELDQMRVALHEFCLRLDRLSKALYQRGLDSRGPITEDKDDIPF